MMCEAHAIRAAPAHNSSLVQDRKAGKQYELKNGVYETGDAQPRNKRFQSVPEQSLRRFARNVDMPASANGIVSHRLAGFFFKQFFNADCLFGFRGPYLPASISPSNLDRDELPIHLGNRRPVYRAQNMKHESRALI